MRKACRGQRLVEALPAAARPPNFSILFAGTSHHYSRTSKPPVCENDAAILHGKKPG